MQDSIYTWLNCLSPLPLNITDQKGHLLNQIVLKVRIEIQARIPYVQIHDPANS